MSKFICKPCEYKSDNKSNYNKHMKSSKHYQKSISVVDNALNNTQLIQCIICKMTFTRKCSLSRHNKICMKNALDIKQREMDVELEKKKKDLEIEYKDKCIADAGKQISELKQYINANKFAPTINISVKKTIQQSFPNAPHIAKLNDYSLIHDDDEIDFSRDLIYYNEINKLNKYLGDIIIKFYKKNNPKDQSLWSTDTARLTYVIKELLANKSSSWCEDFKGKKIHTYIIEPLLEYIHEYTDTAINDLDDELLGATARECIKIAEKQNALASIRDQTLNGQLKDAITKYIAPSFRFNNNELITV